MSRQPRGLRIQVRSVSKHQQAKAPRQRKPVVPAPHHRESSAAKFYMFKYKIGNGRRAVTLKNGVYNYGRDRCPDSFNRSGRCPRGKKCRFAHSTLEMLFHPLTYKTRMCSKNDECEQDDGCAWAHSTDELRRLQQILGGNWRLADPVSQSERQVMKKKKDKKKQSKTRVRLGGAEKNSSESVSRMSLSSTPTPSRPDTPYSAKMTNVSVSASPPLEEEKVKEEDTNHDEMSMPVVCDKLSEFERWFGNTFDCNDDKKPFVGYLRRFEASELDDVWLLWDLHEEMYGKLVGLLVGEIGMADAASRDVFCTSLCEYINPKSVREWMVRVVGLPEYVHMFERFGRMDVLIHTTIDDGVLAEMGIASVGHRAKILLYLEREMA